MLQIPKSKMKQEDSVRYLFNTEMAEAAYAKELT